MQNVGVSRERYRLHMHRFWGKNRTLDDDMEAVLLIMLFFSMQDDYFILFFTSFKCMFF